MSTDDGAPFATRAETIEGIASRLESCRDDAAAKKADIIEDEDATPSEQWYEAGREDAFGTAAELVRAWDSGSPVAPAARDRTDDQHPPGAIEVLGMDWTDDTLAIEYECLACETALVARVGLGGRTLAVSEPDTEYWWRRDRGERPVPSTAAVEGSGTDAETIEENVRATVTWGTSGPTDRDTVVETVAEDLGESDRAVDQCVRAMVRRGELVARDGTLRRVETDGGTEVEAESEEHREPATIAAALGQSRTDIACHEEAGDVYLKASRGQLGLGKVIRTDRQAALLLADEIEDTLRDDDEPRVGVRRRDDHWYAAYVFDDGDHRIQFDDVAETIPEALRGLADRIEHGERAEP